MITETATEYRAQRLRRGSQEAIAEALGLQRVTITRRENGKRRVTREAMLAKLLRDLRQDLLQGNHLGQHHIVQLANHLRANVATTLR